MVMNHVSKTHEPSSQRTHENKNQKRGKKKKKLRVYIKHVQKLLQYIKKGQRDKFNKKKPVF